jgi:hypothetical protein
MNIRNLATICVALLTAALGHAQSAALTPASANVSGGTTVTLTASANYVGAPSAVGWSVTLPEGWSFVGTSGPNPPQVAPQAGATGTLEWAYTNVPADVAVFVITVKAAGKPGTVQLPAKVLLRANGKQQTVEVTPATVSVSS